MAPEAAAKPPGPLALLQGEGLAWSVGDRFILVDVDVQFAPGSLTVLWGDNGAGKSTLLDLLAGLRAADRGLVRLAGVPVAEIHPADLARRLARVGHKPGAYLDLTATENVSLLAALSGQAPTPEAVTASLDRVGLERSDQHRAVRGFSRGMLQRTALARLLLTGADVWLLDEPSTGLDAAGQALLAGLLDEARGKGAAIVVATHDFSCIPPADQWLRVRRGHVSAEGPGAATLHGGLA